MKQPDLWRLVLLAPCWAGWFSVAQAQEVFLGGRVEGRGLTLPSGSECLIVTLEHLVRDAPGFVRVVGQGGIAAQASNVRFYADDLATVRFMGNGEGICEPWPNGTDVDSILRAAGSVFLRSRNSDGSLSQIAVTIRRHDDRYVYIRPNRPEDTLVQGLSGSALAVRGTIVGMLAWVDSAGQGIAQRRDYIERILCIGCPLRPPPEDTLNGDRPFSLSVHGGLFGTRRGSAEELNLGEAGNGLGFEAVARYSVTNSFQVGVGARWSRHRWTAEAEAAKGLTNGRKDLVRYFAEPRLILGRGILQPYLGISVGVIWVGDTGSALSDGRPLTARTTRVAGGPVVGMDVEISPVWRVEIAGILSFVKGLGQDYGVRIGLGIVL